MKAVAKQIAIDKGIAAKNVAYWDDVGIICEIMFAGIRVDFLRWL